MPIRYASVFFLCTFLCLNALPARALLAQLSAEQIVTANGQSIAGKIYLDRDKSRIEMNITGIRIVTIMRRDKMLAYQLMPGNMYMEMPLKGGPESMGLGTLSDAQVAALANAANLVGPEAMNGVACDKYRYHPGQPDAGFVWIAQNTQMPIKLESDDKSMGFELKNLKIGAQNPELFAVPAGYTKLDESGMAAPPPTVTTAP